MDDGVYGLGRALIGVPRLWPLVMLLVASLMIYLGAMASRLHFGNYEQKAILGRCREVM